MKSAIVALGSARLYHEACARLIFFGAVLNAAFVFFLIPLPGSLFLAIGSQGAPDTMGLIESRTFGIRQAVDVGVPVVGFRLFLMFR